MSDGAVLIHCQLSSGEAGIRSRAAKYKSSGGIDQNFGIGFQKFIGNYPAEHFLADETLDALAVDLRTVLKGDDQRGNGDRLIILIGNGNLRLAICTHPRASGLEFVQPPADAMCQHDGQRHTFVGFVRSVAHHNALVACANVLLLINGSCDIGRLLMDTDFQLEFTLGIVAQITHAITDAVDDFCNDLAAVHLCLGSNLAADDHLTLGNEHLNGNAGRGIMGKMCVQNGVCDLIAELVGMTGADGFRRDQSNGFLVHRDSPRFNRSGRPASGVGAAFPSSEVSVSSSHCEGRSTP